MTLGILCPGQGAQHPDMLSMLGGEPAAEAVLAAAQAVLGRDLQQLVSQGGDEIHRNVVAQPLLCASQLATWSALRDRLPTPRVFAGYSVGELAAYACAGALDAREVVDLARRRAEAMDRACPEPSGLLAVRGITRERLDAFVPASQGGDRHRQRRGPARGWRKIGRSDRVPAGGQRSWCRHHTDDGVDRLAYLAAERRRAGVRSTARWQRLAGACRAGVGGHRRWSGIHQAARGRYPVTADCPDGSVGGLHRELA